MSKISTAQKVVMALAGVTIVAFFLEWASHSFFVDGETGFDLATTTESAASGKNLAILFVTPLAAAAIIAIGYYSESFGTRRRWVLLGQMALGFVALIVPLLVVPDELQYWTGGEAGIAYGLWVTATTLAVAVMVALVDLIKVVTSEPTESQQVELLTSSGASTDSAT